MVVVPKYSIGLDYGTSSVRAVLVDISNGEEVATHVFAYPTGVEGVIIDRADPNLARQRPQDYLDGFVETVRGVCQGINSSDIVGIGVDTTGSSPLPIDADGTALANLDQFKDNPAAYCWLWKDHTGHEEAAEITSLAANGYPYLAKCGGTYSSEWFWSKILKCARVAPDVFDAADSWVECCDFVVGFLVDKRKGGEIPRSRCAAGHKAMFEESWGGLPSHEFLEKLDSRLSSLRDRLYASVQSSDQQAGTLCEGAASLVGLSPGIPVAVGAFDAHFGAVASGAAPGVLVKIIGTSTCDCMVHPLTSPLPDIPGLCGIVRESILPGYYGLEAGQSAVGDIFQWFAKFCGQSHEQLTEDASQLVPGESGLISLDWNNGNRTVLVDHRLTGLLVGQTLQTTPAEVYRALIEATGFGALTIINRLEEYGVQVTEIVNCGGISDKSPLIMQIYADICNRPIRVARSAQACALGSAIMGAVAGGAFPDVASAQKNMVGYRERVFKPNPKSVAVYSELFNLYSQLHDAFGRPEWSGSMSKVMKELIRIREANRG